MVTAVDIFQIFIVLITWISQNILCISLMVIYIIKWKKKRQFSVTDKILMYTAFTNFLFQCCTTFDGLGYIFGFYQETSGQAAIGMFALIIFFVYDNIWHSAWLSIHYCLKLMDPSRSVFIEMKKRLSTSIVPLLIWTFLWTARMEFPTNMTNTGSEKEASIYLDIPFTICNMILGCCVPFVVTLACIGLSVGSLVRHMWRMRRSSSQFSSSPQLQGHLRAATIMSLQLLLNVLLYLSVIGVLVSSSIPNVIFQTILWRNITLNPCAQTLTLILGNPKLKRKLFGQQDNE